MIQIFLIFSSAANLFLRLVVGVIYFVHGAKKIKNFKGSAEWFSQIGFKPGRFWAGLVAGAEVVCGAAIFFGIFSQIFSIILLGVMLVAIFVNIRQKQPFLGKIELDLVLIASLAMLASLGSGPFSLDSFFGILL